MLFGSAVTFDTPSPEQDMLEKTYLRRLLRLPTQSSVAGLYLMTGRYPLAMHKLKRVLKFFFYLSKSTAPLLAAAALRDMRQKQLTHPRQKTWLTTLTSKLLAYGIQLPKTPIGGFPDDPSTAAQINELTKRLRMEEI